jgi:hypothetical protein
MGCLALGFDRGVLSRGRGALVYASRPSFTSQLLSLASEWHRGMQFLLESSVALGRRRTLRSVPSGAKSAAANSRFVCVT